MLAHRCSLIDSRETSVDGSSVYSWVTVATDIPCFLDLSFIRKGKDAQWVEAAGRPKDRTGVIFFKGTAPVKSGMRIEITRGPSGMFSIEGALDEAWTPRRKHHLEFGVIEVASVIKRPEYVGDPHV
jgi:hypothetical protein